jgi:hypothetical protein
MNINVVAWACVVLASTIPLSGCAMTRGQWAANGVVQFGLGVAAFATGDVVGGAVSLATWAGSVAANEAGLAGPPRE